MGGHIARMGKMRNIYKILVGKPERKRPLGRPRHRWEGNIRLYLRYIGWEGVGWIYLAHDRNRLRDFVNTVMNVWVL